MIYFSLCIYSLLTLIKIKLIRNFRRCFWIVITFEKGIKEFKQLIHRLEINCFLRAWVFQGRKPFPLGLVSTLPDADQIGIILGGNHILLVLSIPSVT